MATFVLLHGSGQGIDGWQLLREQLERRGHRVFTPAFAIERADEGASWHAAHIVSLLAAAGADPVDTVCLAHSAAGMFLPVIAAQYRPRRMVFLAALVPRVGRSIVELFRADPNMFQPGWVNQDPHSDRVAREFVFHDCTPGRLEWALSTRIYFYARRALEEPCPLAEWPSVPAGYVACADDRTISPAWQVQAARDWLGVEPVVVPGGHCPHVSRPELLAGALESLSES